MKIEPLQRRHIKELHRVIDAVAGERQYFSQNQAMEIGEFTAWVERNIEQGCPQFVAISKRGLVGWSILHTNDLSFLSHCAALFIGLLPRWRGRGIGEQLLQACIDNAWEKQLTRLELEVYAHNTNAIALYKRMGFVKEGLKRHAHLVEGYYRDVVSMALLSEYVDGTFDATQDLGIGIGLPLHRGSNLPARPAAHFIETR